MKSKYPYLFVLVSCSLYVSILFWFAYCYQNGSIDCGLFFNSDALFFPSLFKNIFLEGKHLADWVFPPQSYLFPDVLLYGIAYLSNKNIFTQILIFAILQSILFFFLVSALLSFFIRRLDAISYSAIIATNLITLGLYSGDPYGISFIEVTHFGSLISFLMLSVLLLKYLSASSTQEKYYTAALAVFIATCSANSDRLILIQFVAPILLIGIYFSYFSSIESKSKGILKFGMLLTIGYPLAILVGKIFLPEMGDFESGIGLGSTSNKLAMFVTWEFQQPWLIQISLDLFPIAIIAALFFLYQNGKNDDQHVVARRLVALLILVSPSLVLIITEFSDRNFTSRYLLPYFILSPVFLLIFLSENQSKLFAFLLCCSSCLAIGLKVNQERPSIPLYASYPKFVHCIDVLAQRYGVTRGIAQYWDAIPLYVFSNTGLTVVPVLDDGSPFRVEYNANDFSGKFSFAVIDNDATGLYKISRAAIERHLSKKPFEYQCYDKTVLIFNNESISLPRQSALSNLRSSAVEAFVKNPRALLIMAQEESIKGNHDAAIRLLSEAIVLLRQYGANEDTIRYYESVEENL